MISLLSRPFPRISLTHKQPSLFLESLPTPAANRTLFLLSNPASPILALDDLPWCPLFSAHGTIKYSLCPSTFLNPGQYSF